MVMIASPHHLDNISFAATYGVPIVVLERVDKCVSQPPLSAIVFPSKSLAPVSFLQFAQCSAHLYNYVLNNLIYSLDSLHHGAVHSKEVHGSLHRNQRLALYTGACNPEETQNASALGHGPCTTFHTDAFLPILYTSVMLLFPVLHPLQNFDFTA